MLIQEGKMELTSSSFWIQVVAELLATLLLLFLACGTALPWNNTPPSVIHIAFSQGMTIATLVMAFEHVSGGLVNPALTISMMAAGRVSVLKAAFFIAAQCIGAVCGAAIVYGITPRNSIGALGVIAPTNGVTTAQAFVTELVLTFILVFVIFAVTDPGRGMTGYGVPLAIGICVFICLMQGIPSSGASMNPARSLGPAVIMNSWNDHWIYWVAPIVGGLLATCTYQLLFAWKRTNHSASENYIHNVEMKDKNENHSSNFVVTSL